MIVSSCSVTLHKRWLDISATALCRKIGGEEIGGGDLQSQYASHINSSGRWEEIPGLQILGMVFLGVLCSKYSVRGTQSTNSLFGLE